MRDLPQGLNDSHAVPTKGTHAREWLPPTLLSVAHMADVQWAILEPNGKISFIGKDRGADTAQQDEAKAG